MSVLAVFEKVAPQASEILKPLLDGHVLEEADFKIREIDFSYVKSSQIQTYALSESGLNSFLTAFMQKAGQFKGNDPYPGQNKAVGVC